MTPDIEVYRCTTEDANEWYLAVDVDSIDLLRTPQGFVRESPEGETTAWLTDDEWDCEPVNLEDTPFAEGDDDETLIADGGEEVGQEVKHVAEISGDDVVLHVGCSEDWATWAIETADRSSPGEVTQANVLLKEGDGWNVVTAAKENIEEQLSGGEPVQLLDHAPLSYRVGFSEERARELRDDLESALEFGADAHRVELRLAHSTLQSLVAQFRRQIA